MQITNFNQLPKEEGCIVFFTNEDKQVCLETCQRSTLEVVLRRHARNGRHFRAFDLQAIPVNVKVEVEIGSAD